ncbi:hypothetical protein HAX54_029253 [Datura stramonium]|uniref:Uncharacterized protein n=1 Tax=Datura stramonium TaxID=4076 RepID=A0ABS8V7Q0_DATST|nr:hypothetical protein [Datura stramonium]
MPVVLFYPYDPIKNKSSTTTDSMVQKLEESLSRILTHVYPAAGRFAQDKCSIICQDQGVTLIKAKVNRCMDDEFLQQAHNNLDLALDFWPQGIEDVDTTSLFTTPLMVVQIAIFQCGGLALSVSTAHPAMDGWASFTFMFEWSKVCRLGIPAEKINFMSFDLVNIFGPRDITTMFEPCAIFAGKRSKLVAKKFVMDEVSVSKLRDKLTNCKGSGSICFKPSRVEIVTAILWRAQLRASQAITGEMKRSVMSFPLSLRGKLKYPSRVEIVTAILWRAQLRASQAIGQQGNEAFCNVISLSLRVFKYPETANPFGNFIIEVPIAYEPKDTKMELQDFIVLIRETVQKTVDYCGEASADDVVALVADLYNKSYGGTEWGTSDDVEEFICSSLCSIAVQMDLKEKYMDLIEHDQEFLAFTKF